MIRFALSGMAHGAGAFLARPAVAGVLQTAWLLTSSCALAYVLWHRRRRQSTAPRTARYDGRGGAAPPACDARAAAEAIAHVCHEIRGPMTAILGYAELLLTTPNLSDADREKWVRTIDLSGRQLLALLDDVLNLSRIEAGRSGVASVACSPRAVVDDVLTLLAPTVGGRAIDLRAACGADVPAAVLTDAGKLRQILLNLVGNAIKFTRSGHVLVSTAVHRDGAGDVLRFDVSDTGRGIAAADVARLFRPFARADGAAADAAPVPGTGLGLYISRRLANLLGGDLTVASTPGRGSTFTLTIPLRRCGPAAADDGQHRLDDLTRGRRSGHALGRATAPGASQAA